MRLRRKRADLRALVALDADTIAAHRSNRALGSNGRVYYARRPVMRTLTASPPRFSEGKDETGDRCASANRFVISPA
jgi:hypothetical protein